MGFAYGAGAPAYGLSDIATFSRLAPGEALVFDDSFEHEVWNDGKQERVVLLLDLWHPDLQQDEISAIQSMFSKVEEMQQARKAGSG